MKKAQLAIQNPIPKYDNVPSDGAPNERQTQLHKRHNASNNEVM